VPRPGQGSRVEAIVVVGFGPDEFGNNQGELHALGWVGRLLKGAGGVSAVDRCVLSAMNQPLSEECSIAALSLRRFELPPTEMSFSR
jgi:hypothetical protein